MPPKGPFQIFWKKEKALVGITWGKIAAPAPDPESTIPLGPHPPKPPQCVAILGNILGTGTGKALLAG